MLVQLSFFQLDFFVLFNVVLKIIIDRLEVLVKQREVVSLQTRSYHLDITKVSFAIFKQPVWMNPVVPSWSHRFLYGDTQFTLFIFELIVNHLELFFGGNQCFAKLLVVFRSIWRIQLLLFRKQCPFLFLWKLFQSKRLNDRWPSQIQSHLMSFKLFILSFEPTENNLCRIVSLSKTQQFLFQDNQPILTQFNGWIG